MPAIDSVEEKLERVAAGEGIAVVPASTAGFYTRPDVAVIGVEDLGPGHVAVAWPSGRDSALIREFAAAAGELLPGPAGPLPPPDSRSWVKDGEYRRL